MIIDHIGVVVKSITDGIIHRQEVFVYNQFTEVVVNTRQKVKVVFLKKENSLPVKLLEPVNQDSSIYRFEKK